MTGVIDSLEREQLRDLPRFDPGDRVKVHFQVVEGGRRRTQVFEGVVIKRQGAGARETFTVRKQSFGVGVERTFPLHSPKIERIEIVTRGDVRRAKLYYLRGRVGRRARVRERRYAGEVEAPQGELADAQGALEEAEPLVAQPEDGEQAPEEGQPPSGQRGEEGSSASAEPAGDQGTATDDAGAAEAARDDEAPAR